MGILYIDIHHAHRMLANGLSASLHVCLVLLYLYVVYRVLAAVRGRRSDCLSSYLSAYLIFVTVATDMSV